MPYAVNIVDLVCLKNDLVLMMLLAEVITSGIEVKTERCIDGVGIMLDCTNERADAIVQIARKKYPRLQLRLYHSKTGKGSWKRV